VLVDNHSTDESLIRISEWSEKNDPEHVSLDAGPKAVVMTKYDRLTAESGGLSLVEKGLSQDPQIMNLIFIESNENIGFARGCNLGIRYALSCNADYIWLLNNDTVTESNSLSAMVDFLEIHADIQGVTCQIRWYDDPSRVWNCGGNINAYGDRRYFHHNASINRVPNSGYKLVTFVTGCASLFRSKLFKETGLLTERFFHGEEDFELGLRLKRLNLKLACLYKAIVYHKGSVSINKAADDQAVGLGYIFYLNRLLNIRNYLHPLIWFVWRIMCLFYIVPTIKSRYQLSWAAIIRFCQLLLKDTIELRSVNKQKFNQVLNGMQPYNF
jgi:GT2 family glycosyltransferase